MTVTTEKTNYGTLPRYVLSLSAVTPALMSAPAAVPITLNDSPSQALPISHSRPELRRLDETLSELERWVKDQLYVVHDDDDSSAAWRLGSEVLTGGLASLSWTIMQGQVTSTVLFQGPVVDDEIDSWV
jgi:hypothetical protein